MPRQVFLLLNMPAFTGRTSALDALTRDEMSIELQRIWSLHEKTVVFVTHDIAEWRDEIAWMSLYFSAAVWASLALCVCYAFMP